MCRLETGSHHTASPLLAQCYPPPSPTASSRPGRRQQQPHTHWLLSPLSSLLSPPPQLTTTAATAATTGSWLASEGCCWQFVSSWRDWRGIEGARVPRPDSCPCPPCCHAGAGLQLLSQHHSNTTSNTTTGVTTSQ